MKVCSIQFNPEAENKSKRISKANKWVKKASNHNPDLIILPELWNVGFFNFEEYKTSSESLEDSKTIEKMSKLAKEVESYIHIGSIVERKGSRFFNTSVLLDENGKALTTYKKIHLFSYKSRENEILTSGNDSGIAETNMGNFGLATCYDLRFPELFRDLVDKGVQIFLVTSAWPSSRPEHWRLFNQVRALENQAYLISSNCVGETREGSYLGNSMIVNPTGEIVASSESRESIVKAEIDIEDVKKAREEFPALKDRKYLFYQ